MSFGRGQFNSRRGCRQLPRDKAYFRRSHLVQEDEDGGQVGEVPRDPEDVHGGRRSVLCSFEGGFGGVAVRWVGREVDWR